jgi:hypothetical protein
MTKGYVVRYTNERGTFYVAAPKWLDDYTIGTARTDEGVLFDALPAAVAASRHPRKVTTVTILAVAEDGTETPLPSYEEALAEISGADTVLTLVGQPPDGRRLILRITDAMGAAGDMLRGAHAEIARLRTTERPEEKRLREAVAAMRRLLREPEREGIPGFADVCAALDALHRALWGPSGRLADRDAKGAD